MDLKKGLYFGSFDPVHKGHIQLINIVLENYDYLDIRVGNKKKSKLPHYLKKEILENVLLSKNINKRVNIIEENLFSLDTQEYSGLIIGSDIYNKLSIKNNKFKDKEINFFDEFNEYIIVNRKNYEINLYNQYSLFENKEEILEISPPILIKDEERYFRDRFLVIHLNTPSLAVGMK